MLVAVGIGVIARARYLVLGGRRPDTRLPAQDQERLAEAEERLDSSEQALRRQSEQPRFPPD